MPPTAAPEPIATNPGDRWRESLARRELPATSGTSPGDDRRALTPERFRWKPEKDALRPLRPSRRRALEALPEGGTVLDVGVGAGASSLGLARRAGLIIGVDRIAEMLDAFQASAAEEGVRSQAVIGTWPEVAPQVGAADVVVCHHAMYGVREIEAFLHALTAHARHRVVIELSEHPPQSGLDPLWEELHGQARPEHRVADAAQAVAEWMGLGVAREDIVIEAAPGPGRSEVSPDAVAFARRSLGVGPEHDERIARFLQTLVAQPHRVAAMWWPGSAHAGPGAGD